MSPSIDVVGAYFPDWMFCIVGAVAVSVALRPLLEHLGKTVSLGPATVLYPTLVLLFALVGWLLFFQN